MSTKFHHVPPLTHFLCIPLVTPASRAQLVESLGALAADVTDPAGPGLPADAVRPVGTLHLTLCMFRFPAGAAGSSEAASASASASASTDSNGTGTGIGNGNGNRQGLDAAIQLLRSLQLRSMLADARKQARRGQRDGEASAPPAPAGGEGEGEASWEEETEPDARLKITLRGLHGMRRATTEASVLYAAPDDGHGALQAFCERLRQVFADAGLCAAEDAGRPLLLHATLVNTIYVKDRDRDRAKGKGKGKDWGRGRGRGRSTFDARGVMERYEDEVWMRDVVVDKVAICEMGAKKTLVDGVEDEEYRVVAEVGF